MAIVMNHPRMSERVRGWARRLRLDRHAELWMGAVRPAASLTEVRARVLRVVPETSDAKTFVLRPNRHWAGHRAGQYVPVEVEIDGVRVRRHYSVASPPGVRDLEITVKRVPGGRVSEWLHERVEVGDVLGLGAAAGDFVLPEPAPTKLLLYTGGSGITPAMAILRDLAARGVTRDIVVVHHARSRPDVIFGAELQALAARQVGLRVELRLDDALEPDRRFDPRWLAAEVPDHPERATFLCGPPGLMAAVEAWWARVGATERLRQERFVVPAAPGGGGQVSLHLSELDRRVSADSGRSLLEQLERAGEHPAYGCRMGVCRSCVCTKRSGAVRDLLTGAVSDAPDEDIRLCVSAPESDLELRL